ncbi:Hypothetical predicted protein [Cloeon dipterum]|uniref:Uncharacterized protein n=1 Tax=Cloeon dipterum TaxID=197152 RepID=A0A8S1D2I7_9INSE|nr:Hypothetical predicted protein [Cloeon dipterum]
MKRAKGVAKEFAAEYGPIGMTDELYNVGTVMPQQKGSAVLLSVVSKERFYHKFSFDPETFLARLSRAILGIASKTDRVHWRWTQCKLLEAFADMDIELAVYLKMRPREVRAQQRSTGRGEGGARTVPKVTAATGGPSVALGVPGPAGEHADPNCAPAATRVGSGKPEFVPLVVSLTMENSIASPDLSFLSCEPLPNDAVDRLFFPVNVSLSDADAGLNGQLWRDGAQKSVTATAAASGPSAAPGASVAVGRHVNGVQAAPRPLTG